MLKPVVGPMCVVYRLYNAVDIVAVILAIMCSDIARNSY